MRPSLTATLILILALWAPLAGAKGPRDNLVIQSIPPIPADLVARLNQYQNIRNASFQDWHPRGGLVVATRFAETAQIHHIPFPGGRREQLTFFPERVSSASLCPRAEAPSLIVEMDEGGSEFYQIYRLDLATGRHAMLTDGKSRNMAVLWNRGGDRIAYSSTKRNGRDFDIWIMDPQRPQEAKLLLETEGHWVPLDFSPDDKELLVLHYVSVNETHLFRVDTSTGRRRPLTPEGKVAYGAAKYSPDGRSIYLVSDLGGEFMRLGVVDREAKGFRPRFLTSSIPWNVESFDVSPEGVVALATNEDGFGRIYLLGPEGRLTAVEGPVGVISGLSFPRRGGALAFSLSGPRTSGDVYTLDPATRKIERWTYSETGGLDGAAFQEPTLIRYPTFDQADGQARTIPALLTLPPSSHRGPHPVLILIHGGPEGQARPWFLGSQNFDVHELGVAVIQPNVRGSTGYGKSYTLLDNGRLREDSVKDIGALLDWIKTRPDLDASRVAVYGGSYGGYMSLATMTHYSDRLRCGISYVGISNFVTFLENTQTYRRDLRRVEYGDERDKAMRDHLNSISPLTRAERIKVPLLVLQGANDPRVPASESDQIVERVRRGGQEVWYLLAKDEGHGFVKKSNADYAKQAIALFLQRFLLGE